MSLVSVRDTAPDLITEHAHWIALNSDDIAAVRATAHDPLMTAALRMIVRMATEGGIRVEMDRKAPSEQHTLDRLIEAIWVPFLRRAIGDSFVFGVVLSYLHTETLEPTALDAREVCTRLCSKLGRREYSVTEHQFDSISFAARVVPGVIAFEASSEFAPDALSGRLQSAAVRAAAHIAMAAEARVTAAHVMRSLRRRPVIVVPAAEDERRAANAMDVGIPRAVRMRVAQADANANLVGQRQLAHAAAVASRGRGMQPHEVIATLGMGASTAHVPAAAPPLDFYPAPPGAGDVHVVPVQEPGSLADADAVARGGIAAAMGGFPDLMSTSTTDRTSSGALTRFALATDFVRDVALQHEVLLNALFEQFTHTRAGSAWHGARLVVNLNPTMETIHSVAELAVLSHSGLCDLVQRATHLPHAAFSATPAPVPLPEKSTPA
jgi:hypothetical protein